MDETLFHRLDKLKNGSIDLQIKSASVKEYACTLNLGYMKKHNEIENELCYFKSTVTALSKSPF